MKKLTEGLQIHALRIVLILLSFLVPLFSYLNSGYLNEKNIATHIIFICFSLFAWVLLLIYAIKKYRLYSILLVLPFAFWFHAGICGIYLWAVYFQKG